jgi:hypothetical protein
MARRGDERGRVISRVVGRALVAVDGGRAVEVRSLAAFSEKAGPWLRVGRSDELTCRGRVVERRIRPGRGARHVPRTVIGGRSRRSAPAARRSHAAFLGGVPVDGVTAGCVSQSRRSGDHARSRGPPDLSGGFRQAGPIRRFAPSVCCVPKPGRPGPQRRTPTFFRRCRGGSFCDRRMRRISFPRPGHLCIAKQKNRRLAVLRSATARAAARGRRTRVQARSHGQAFRDRTEGNKPASGRRNPRPRKSGPRS